MRPLGDALPGGERVKVRAASRHEDEWREPSPLDRREKRLRDNAVRMDLRQRRQPGKRPGGKDTLSFWDVAVLEYLEDLAVRFEGRVFPAIAGIAQAVGCCARTVCRALARLKAAGWLDWTHRCRKLDAAGEKGPQVEQISNWYYLRVPPWAAALIAKWRGRKPIVSRDLEHQSEAQAAYQARCEAERLAIQEADIAADKVRRAAELREAAKTRVWAVPSSKPAPA